MSFFPLDRDILTSSLWSEPSPVLKVWLYMLLSANPRTGIVRDTEPALAQRCAMSREELRGVLEILEAPDADSRSKRQDGRRIERCNGGFKIINYAAHRDKDYSTPRWRKWKAKQNPTVKREPTALANVSNVSQPLPTTDTDTDTDTDTKPREPYPPYPPAPGAPAPEPPASPRNGRRKPGTLTADQQARFEVFYTAYPNKVARGAAERAFASLDPNDILLAAMVDSIVKQNDWRTQAPPGSFRPPWKNPATWINQRCWEDRPADDVKNTDRDRGMTAEQMERLADGLEARGR